MEEKRAAFNSMFRIEEKEDKAPSSASNNTNTQEDRLDDRKDGGKTGNVDIDMHEFLDDDCEEDDDVAKEAKAPQPSPPRSSVEKRRSEEPLSTGNPRAHPTGRSGVTSSPPQESVQDSSYNSWFSQLSVGTQRKITDSTKDKVDDVVRRVAVDAAARAAAQAAPVPRRGRGSGPVKPREPPVQAQIEIKPPEQFPAFLHDKAVSKSDRATRVKYLTMYGPAALDIFAKAFANTGDAMYEFFRLRLLFHLQGSKDDMGTQEVFDMSWMVMEAGAYLSPEELANVHDPNPSRHLSLATQAAAVLFHCLGKHMALSRLTSFSKQWLGVWVTPDTYYRKKDGGRFKTLGVRKIGETWVTFSGKDCLIYQGNSNLRGNYRESNQNNGAYRRPTSDEIASFTSTVLPDLVQVQDGETFGHYYTDDDEQFVTIQSDGGILVRFAIVKLYKNLSPFTGGVIKGPDTSHKEGVKGDLVGDVHCIEFPNISLQDGYAKCSRRVSLHAKVGEHKLFHFKGFEKDVAETEHMPGIRSCYLAKYLEPLGHGRDNHALHRRNPGRFLDPDNGERGNALHSAPMGYVARKVAGGPREVNNLPSTQVREGHPWYQRYLAWSAARSA